MGAHTTDILTRLDLAALLDQTQRTDQASALLQATAQQAPDDPRPSSCSRGSMRAAATLAAPLQPMMTPRSCAIAAAGDGGGRRLRGEAGRCQRGDRHYQAIYESASASPLARELAANNLAMLLVTYRKDRTSLPRAQELTSSFATSQITSLLDTYGWVRYRSGD